MIIPNSSHQHRSAFLDYTAASTSVTIPNSATSIGENAFYSCTSLSSVTILNGADEDLGEMQHQPDEHTYSNSVSDTGG